MRSALRMTAGFLPVDKPVGETGFYVFLCQGAFGIRAIESRANLCMT